MKSRRILTLSAVAVGSVLFSIALQASAAFTQPAGAPPTADADAPLTTGATAQGKTGGLLLNTGAAANGLLVQFGNVGIGTVSPLSKLHIDGGGEWMRMTGIPAAGNGIVRFFNDAGGSGAGFFMNGSAHPSDGGNNGFSFYNDMGGIRFRSSGGNMIFATGGFPGTDILTLAGSNVGIGSTTPNQKLVVTGNINVPTGSCYMVNGVCLVSGGGTVGGSGTVNYVPKWATASTLANSLIFDNGTNVGIGTAAPGQKLTVAGTIESTSGGIKFPDGTTQATAAAGGASPWTTSGANIYNANAGNVGIGAATVPTYNLQVFGSFAATYKNFVIADPLDLQNKLLVHSSLEGPEHAVYYRGEAELAGGRAKIELPTYFEALTRKENRTVLLTNIDGFDQLAVKSQAGVQVKDGTFIVYSSNPTSAQKFSWEVKAVRADIPTLVPEIPKTANMR
jgi:hypothetical protein